MNGTNGLQAHSDKRDMGGYIYLRYIPLVPFGGLGTKGGPNGKCPVLLAAIHAQPRRPCLP